MSNQLAKAPEKAIEIHDKDNETTKKARELVTRLRYMIQNGRKLEEAEVFALAQYCAVNELNPFSGEAYYIPGAGPTPGVAGWRRKAQEDLEYEAKRTGEIAANFWTTHRPAVAGEAIFSPGDIAVYVELRDSLSNKVWRRAYFETVRELKELGDDNPFENAKQFAGPEPVWTGVGVVYAAENFGGKEKFDRYERAQKRAEKIALRKRFPRVNLPEPEGVNGDMVDVEWVKEEPSTQPEKHTEAENLAALGFGPVQHTQQPVMQFFNDAAATPEPDYQDEP